MSISENMAIQAWRIAHSAGYFIAALFYHLICSLTETKRKKIQLIGYGQALFFIAMTCGTPWVLFQTRSFYNFFYAVATPLYTVGVFLYLLFVFLSFIELVRYLKTAKGYKKLQAQYLFYGFFIGFTGGTSLLLPEFYIDWFYPAGNAGVFIYAAIITYALLKDKILEVEEHAQIAHRDKLAAIGTLAASLNHELRNPLYIAKGKIESYLDAAERKIFANNEANLSKSQEVLTSAHSQLTRAMDIMQRFSDFAKPLGTKNYQEKVLIKETVQDVLGLVSNEFEMNKISVTEIPHNGVNVYANKRQLEEIFFNLIINACHAMEKTGGELRFKAYQPNGKVMLEISDTGPGISKENQSRLFEPFYSTKAEKGTGLGLYITKKFVEENGGKISVKSKIGKGTTFTLTLRKSESPFS